MSDFEMLLTAWLQGGEIPADFKPSSNVEEYLLAILNGVDDDVDPKSRADVLLDAIATKYAGYAEGLEELRGVSGMTAHHVPGGDTPEEVAAFLRLLNTLALQDLAAKGATGVSDNTTDILDAYANLPSGGGTEYSSIEYDEATNTYTLAEKDDPTITHTLTCTYDAQGRISGMVYDDKAIAVTYNNDDTVTVGGTVVDVSEFPNDGVGFNIAFDTQNPPTDTSKLWVKATQPQNVTVDYNPDNTIETVTALSTVLPNAAGNIACGVVGTKCYLFGGAYAGGNRSNEINVFNAKTEQIATPSATLPSAVGGATCCVVGTKIYIFGGAAAYDYLGTICAFDTTNNTIFTLSATLPKGVWGSTCGAVGKKIYIFGGQGRENWSDVWYNTICVFDTETETLTTLSATLPVEKAFATCGVVGEKIYIFGGANSNGRTNTIYVFDTTTNTISTLAATLPTATNTTCGVVGTKCYLFGGSYADGKLNTINVFDAETETLSTLIETLPQAVSGTCCGVVGLDCYIFGGGTTTEIDTINKFNVTFSLDEGDVYLQSDVFKNKFTLVTAPTEVETGVSAVYVGNAQNEAENAEAYLHDGTQWRQI